MADTLRDIPLHEAPEAPEEWLDFSELALGFDVMAQPGEVALIVHMPEGAQHVGFSFDADGARALGAALIESAETADDN